MHDDSTVYIINKANELPEKEAKIPKCENGDITEDSSSALSLQSQHAFKVAKKYKVIFNVHPDLFFVLRSFYKKKNYIC